MKRAIFLSIGLLIPLLTVQTFAEEVYLNNGDRITGKLIKETESEIVLQTQGMGEIIILKSFVLDLQKKDERKEETQPTDDLQWTRRIALGYNQSGGNTQKGQGSFAGFLNRKTDSDEWTFKAEAYYSSADKKMDAKKLYGMLRYAFSFGEDFKWYNFYKLETDQDRFANIDYRLTPSLGIGYWFSDTEDYKWMSEIAVGYEYTNFRDTTDSRQETILIPRMFLEKKLINNLSLSQDIFLYSSLSDLGEYRMHAETALVNTITESLALKISFIDDYNSYPSAGTKKNDYRLISALEYSF